MAYITTSTGSNITDSAAALIWDSGGIGASAFEGGFRMSIGIGITLSLLLTTTLSLLSWI